MKKKWFLYLFLVFCFVSFATAENALYSIADEVIIISGRTKEKTIATEIGSVIGREFATKQELDDFVAARLKQIEALRAFDKFSVVAVFPHNAPMPNEEQTAQNQPPIPVVLEIRVKDGWPFFSVPYASFNSDEGFMTGIFANAPNMLGSLQNLTMIAFYIAPPDEQSVLQWADPNLKLEIQWTNIKLRPFTLNIFSTIAYTKQNVELRGSPMIKSRLFYIKGDFEFDYNITDALKNTVTLSANKGFNPTLITVKDPSYLQFGPLSGSVGLSNTISYTDYDWVNNFRKGIKAGVTAGYTRTFPEYADGQNEFWLKTFMSWYGLWGKYFNPNVRIFGFINSGLASMSAATYIRGVRNTELMGNVGVYLNTNVQIKLFRLGSIEVHISPTFDYAFTYAFSAPDYQGEHAMAVGAEVYIFADFLKSMPVKVGIAYDLRPKYVPSNTNKRLEIEVNFNFTY